MWGYVLLEELLHKQMLLCAVGHLQRKGGIQETQGKKVSLEPLTAFYLFFFFFCFPGALYMHSAALRVWVDVSLILLLVQLNLS